MTITEEFIVKFHSLDGQTIGEKRKNLFLLLNNTTNVDQIQFDQVHPQNFLEEKFKIDLLLHFKRVADLIDILQSERPLQIQRLLKRSPWFIEQLVTFATVDDLVLKVFPNTSFRTKVKILNKLAILLNDSKKAQEYFEAVDKRYGTYLASKLLPSCNGDYIINFFNERHFKPNPKQALTIIKRYPEIAEEIVDIVMKFDNAVEEYKNIFEYIKVHDVNLLLEINDQHRLCLRLGWRTTKKYLHLHQAEVIDNPKKYYKLLHNKQIAKSIHHNFNSLFINLFPQDLDDFHHEYYTIISLLKGLPKSMRQSSLLVNNFRKLYGKDFWSSEYVSLEILEWLTTDERKFAIDNAKKPLNILEAKWNSYLKTDKSLPLLKKQISLSSQYKTRATLVECLVHTCKINMDDSALLDVCKYMLMKHRNDHFKVRKSFMDAIKEDYKVENLSEDIWKYLNDFITIFEVNDEDFLQMREYRKFYIRFRLIRNLPIEDQLLQWVRSKYDDFLIFPTNPQFQLHCFNVLADLTSKELKGENLLNSDIKLLQQVIHWNANRNEQIPLFTFENAIQSLKKKIADDNVDHYDVKILTFLIKEECARDDSTFFKIYLDLPEKYGNVNILTWILQNFPRLINEHIEGVVDAFLKSYYITRKTCYFFKYVNNYSEILESVIKSVQIQYKNYEERNAIVALSTIQKPDDFIRIVEKYYPTEAQADAKSEESRKLYQIQETVTKCLKNLNPPSVSLPSILKFCKGDYLKLIRASLYSCCDNVNENKLISFLSQLIDQAVSIRKHALHLTFRTLDKNQVYALIKHFMEKEKNDSVKKFIFKGCFNFFVKNPDNFTWELVVLNLNSVDVNDTEAVEILLQFEKVPNEYRSKYVILTWDVINTVPDPNNTRTSKLTQILRGISKEMIPTLPQEFYDKVIDNYFCKEAPSLLTFFASSVNAFVCKYILYADSAIERKLRLETSFGIVKEYVFKSGVRAISCSAAIDFLKEFCLLCLKDHSNDQELFEEFSNLWNTFLQPHEYFDEYLHLKLVTVYMESLTAHDLGSRLGELCDSLVNTYGDVIIGMIYNKIEFFTHYFFKNGDDDDRYDLIESLTSENASMARLILGILLLDNSTPSVKRTKRRYDQIIDQLEKFDNPTIRLYVCSIFSKNLKLYYS